MSSFLKQNGIWNDKEAGKNPPFDMKLESMIPVIRREIPLKAHAHRADDILTAVRIAKEFNLKLTLDHCTDGALIADELAKEQYPAFVGPTFGNKSKVELENKSFETPKILNDAGVTVSIITDAPVIPLQYLPCVLLWQLKQDWILKRHGAPLRSTLPILPVSEIV